jgi:transposase
MSDLIWLSEAQMRRIEPYFPLSHGVPRVDDRRIISGIIFVIRNGLRWRDAPADYDQLMIDATHLKAHRTAASLLKKGLFPDVSDVPKAA